MLDAQDLSQRLKAVFGQAKIAANNWLRIPCPTCEPRHRKKLKRYVSLYNGDSKCYICERPLTLTDLLGHHYIPTHVNSPVVYEERQENPQARILPGSRFIPVSKLGYDHPAVKFLHKDFLFSLTEYYENNGIIYCPSDAGKIFCRSPFISSADRLIFPVHYLKQLVGWQMRSIPGTVYGDMPDVVKYYHLFNKGSYLYNYDRAINYEIVVLVEGIKKALKLPNAVASLGKNVSPVQAQLLQANWKNIIILLDAGFKEQEIGNNLALACSRHGCKALNVDIGKYNLPSPDEATTEQLTEILANEWSSFVGRTTKIS